ncbi:MAG: YbjN domain-containing protein [Spirulinaceae cyanobacterium SM2_1_0]|nr:YbjN domain-containing protein [Spirulinaceae cyanobacterium SM2_1_0]
MGWHNRHSKRVSGEAETGGSRQPFFQQISTFVAQAIADLDGETLAALPALPATKAALFDSIQSYFERNGWQCQRLTGKTALRFTYQGQHGKWVCFVSTREQARQVIIYSIYPQNVPETQRLVIAEFFTRANYHLTLGSFEMDFESGQVRLRASLAIASEAIDAASFQQLLLHNLQTADRHLPGFLAVLSGKKRPREAIAEI